MCLYVAGLLLGEFARAPVTKNREMNGLEQQKRIASQYQNLETRSRNQKGCILPGRGRICSVPLPLPLVV